MAAFTHHLPVWALSMQNPNLGDALIFVLGGFVMVIFALAALWAATSINGLIVKIIARRTAVPEEPKTSPAPITSATAAAAMLPPVLTKRPDPDEDFIDDATLVALIGSAVHVALDHAQARIVSIKPSPATRAWSVEGRRAIFDSHKIR